MGKEPGPFEASGLPYSHTPEPPPPASADPKTTAGDNTWSARPAAIPVALPEFPGIVAAGPDRPVPHAPMFYTLALPPTPDAGGIALSNVRWRLVAIAALVAIGLALAAIGAALAYAHHV